MMLNLKVEDLPETEDASQRSPKKQIDESELVNTVESSPSSDRPCKEEKEKFTDSTNCNKEIVEANKETSLNEKGEQISVITESKSSSQVANAVESSADPLGTVKQAEKPSPTKQEQQTFFSSRKFRNKR